MKHLLAGIAIVLHSVMLPAAAQPPVATAPIIARVSDRPVSFADLPAPREFVTRHKATIRGKALAYTATAGETYITNMSGEPIARLFSFSYVKDASADGARPVMFVFNGGPGSASIWLHLGVLGPQRVVLDREVNPSNTPPFGLANNPHSVLDVADLVFIDPVGTGFSHAVGNAKDTDFASVDADADVLARFIELWLSKQGRWNSPKYLLGESYGTIRAAVLPRALMGGPTYTGVMRGITVDGVILIGSALDLGAPSRGGAIPPAKVDPAVVALPGLAVTAWHHKKITRHAGTAAEFYDEVKTFGATEYALSLWKLDNGALSDAEKDGLARKLQEFTGLPAQAWIQAGLRIPAQAFVKQLLADSGLEAGMYDSRYTLPLAGSGGDPVADDAAMGRYVPGFVAAFNVMLRDQLQVRMPIPYTAIAFDFSFNWNYARSGVPEGQSFAADLATAMRRTPALRVLVASGYYDMVTTPAAAENQIKRGGLPLDRVTFRNYESGHMLYLGGTAARFAEDIRIFLAPAPSR